MRLGDVMSERLGIWGFGVEGRAALAMLASSFAGVVVVDDSIDLDERGGEGVRFYNTADQLLSCAVVVVSPGVSCRNPLLAELRRRGIRLVSGSALWLESNAQHTIGVTGTKGKSTTASLIHTILGRAEISSTIAGNIGVPLIGVERTAGVVVAELSSYQCWWITRSPRVAVVTNLFEEHLPWHGSLQNYWRAKARIATAGAEVLICNSDTLDKLVTTDHTIAHRSLLVTQEPGAEVLAGDGSPMLSVDDLPSSLRASHLVSSVRFAVLAASLFIDISKLSSVLKSALDAFSPLPHRLAVVATTKGVTWVDDSLSTTAQSVIAAAQSFWPGRVILIVGGQDRGISYHPLNEYLISHSETIDVVAIPSNGTHAVAAFRDRHPFKVHEVASLREAVAVAACIADAGSHVVLSPGAPSHDYYRNFEAKSAEFRDAIEQLGNF